jgi:hypothetical protein
MFGTGPDSVAYFKSASGLIRLAPQFFTGIGMTDDQLILRKTTFGDGQTYPDDWQVFWRGLPIGRILKQPGVPYGRPNWWWGVNWDQRPVPAGHKGICVNLDECKRRFKLAWSGVRAEKRSKWADRARS